MFDRVLNTSLETLEKVCSMQVCNASNEVKKLYATDMMPNFMIFLGIAEWRHKLGIIHLVHTQNIPKN